MTFLTLLASFVASFFKSLFFKSSEEKVGKLEEQLKNARQVIQIQTAKSKLAPKLPTNKKELLDVMDSEDF